MQSPKSLSSRLADGWLTAGVGVCPLLQALHKQAASEPSKSQRVRLVRRASEEVAAAVDALTIAYGADHPAVVQWRASNTVRVGGVE